MKKLALGAVVVLVAACSQTSAQQAKRAAPGDVVAKVGTATITLADVDDKALEQPASNFGSAKLSQAIFEARRAALDELIATSLMDAAAKAQGIERSALVEKEITAKIPPVSDSDVTTCFNLKSNNSMFTCNCLKFNCDKGFFCEGDELLITSSYLFPSLNINTKALVSEVVVIFPVLAYI